MKRIPVAVILLILSVSALFAQRNVAPAIARDPILEADAKRNLDVARQGFAPLKRAYKQVIMRFDETFAAYPEFSQIDEFLYLAGMSSFYLSENKGKQKVDPKSEKEMAKFAPGKLKDEAVIYLTLLVDKYPESKWRDEAAKTLAELKTMKWESPDNPPPVLSTKN